MSRPVRSVLALTLVAAMLAPCCFPLPAARAAEESCFPATGFCVRGAFLDYWVASGGLPLNGYPLTEQRLETLEDGEVHTVQYFERVRLEYHPENPAPNDVLLGQFGRRIHPAEPPVGPSGDGTYYPEPGHNIGGPFLAYWRGHGGLAQFGYPLGEQFRERLEDGKTYTVQYFERARFERHPENPAPYDVLLGQFGRRILAEAMPLPLAPCAAGDLVAAVAPDAGAGQRNATITLANTGATACALAGAPGVQLLDASGRPLDLTAQAGDGAPVDIVVLPPGLLAAFGLRWGNWCGVDPGAVGIRVTMPDGGGQFTTGGIGTPPCLGADQPSTLGITAFRLDGIAAGANVVLRYYAAINARDYRAAYGLLGPALRAQQGYDAFAAGYADTQRVAVGLGAIDGGSGPGTFRVVVRLVATQIDGSSQRFSGTYDVGVVNGTYAITGAGIAPEN